MHINALAHQRTDARIKRFVIAVLIAAALGCAACTTSPIATPAAQRFDLVIENGRVIDGTGAARFHGDIGITGDRISVVTTRDMLHSAGARQRLDAACICVCARSLCWARLLGVLALLDFVSMPVTFPLKHVIVGRPLPSDRL